MRTKLSNHKLLKRPPRPARPQVGRPPRAHKGLPRPRKHK